MEHSWQRIPAVFVSRIVALTLGFEATLFERTEGDVQILLTLRLLAPEDACVTYVDKLCASPIRLYELISHQRVCPALAVKFALREAIRYPEEAQADRSGKY